MRWFMVGILVVLLVVAGCGSLQSAHAEDPPRTVTGDETTDWIVGILLSGSLVALGVAIAYGG